jgi:hypothetical protein
VPRYYFHIDEPDTDPEGTELAGIDAARHEAFLAAREILAEKIAGGHDEVPMRILIADETGGILDVIHMRDLLPRALREK